MSLKTETPRQIHLRRGQIVGKRFRITPPNDIGRFDLPTAFMAQGAAALRGSHP
jgi:hypothetical protein